MSIARVLRRSGPLTALLLPVLTQAAPVRITIQSHLDWSPPGGKILHPHHRAIHPVWSRQNVWKPWVQWTRTPPTFAPYFKEAAMVLATGARPYPHNAVDAIPELYRENGKGGLAPFDPSHPFFQTLLLFRKSGIRPFIDLGPVPLPLCKSKDRPRIGVFEFSVDGPADSASWDRYHHYVVALFRHLQGPGMFTPAEISTWGYQLLREPDNPECWDPAHRKRFSDPANLREYQKLYDWTLGAMRAAGVMAPLSIGNLAVPFPGSMGHGTSWLEPLAKWLASGSKPLSPHLKLPRVGPRDTLTFSFTAYGGAQMSENPEDLNRILDKVRTMVRRHFPGDRAYFTVGEGNLALVPGNNRSDGTELGAAWNAAIFKNSLDAGLHRYTQWGFSSGDHLSVFEDGRGIMSPTYNVVRMFQRMEGSRRKRVSISPPGRPGQKARLDALAGSDNAGTLRLVVYHYQPDRSRRDAAETSIEIEGLKPGGRYRLAHFRVDRHHSNYFTSWLEDLGHPGMRGDPHDALVGFQLTEDQRTIWKANVEKYLRLSALARQTEEIPSTVSADSRGKWKRKLVMPSNSVSLLELVPEP